MHSYIFINNLRFYAFHGVGAQEQTVGNEYQISIRLQTDISQAMQTDEVIHTVNYAEVFETIKKEMSIPSALLEHVAGRIIRAIFLRFDTVEAIELKLTKRNPPMGADSDGAGVEIHCQRHEVIN